MASGAADWRFSICLESASANLSLQNSNTAIRSVLESIPPYPSESLHGDEIIICGGGIKLFPSAWVCINLLRDFGCKLPIELWHFGSEEMDETMKSLVSDLGVNRVEAIEVRKSSAIKNLGGWELKAYSIIYSQFRRVLLLDADNMILTNATPLFDWPEFAATGAVFWPDFGKLGRERTAWRAFGVEYVDEPEFESGQILLDKERSWKALMLALWFNAHSDFFFKFAHGNKETFHLAFRKTGAPFAMPSRGINPLESTMCQHDFDGVRIFQHRNLDKWQYDSSNRNIADFWLDDRCRFHLKELQQRWNGQVAPIHRQLRRMEKALLEFKFLLTGPEGNESLIFGENGSVMTDKSALPRTWRLTVEDQSALLVITEKNDNQAQTFRRVAEVSGST